MSTQVPFFEYPRLWSDDREEFLSIIDNVSSSGGFILQKAVSDFELQLANYVGSNYAVGVGNATDGMEIFLEAIGINPGDEIIISSHTMLATASAIKFTGGTPIPVDIGTDNLISIQAIEDAITPNTVGIMPTQLNGRVCNMDAIIAIAQKHGLFIVEDAAQALGAKYKGQHAGTFGLASDISFFPAKVLGCLGDAGGVLVNDKDLYHKIFQLHDHGRDVDGEVRRWGRNSRLDSLQALVLNEKLRKLAEWNEVRKHTAKLYFEFLSDIPELQMTEELELSEGVYHLMVVRHPKRDLIRKKLDSFGIQSGIHYPHALTQLPHYSNDLNPTACPEAEKAASQVFSLPMGEHMNPRLVKCVCDSLRTILSELR